MEALLPTKIEEEKDDDKDKDKKAGDETEESQEENPLDVSMSEEITLPDHLREMVDEVSEIDPQRSKCTKELDWV